MNDVVFVRQLAVETLVGIHPWERETPQTVLISFELDTDIRPAAGTDDIARTLDYDAAARAVTALVTASRFFLIETMAEAVAQLLLDELATSRVRVEVLKPGAVAAAETVGVRIERARNG